MFKKKAPATDLKCLNCETQYSGWFCPQCGQKCHVRRLTTLEVIKDFLEAISDSDKGFLRTVIDLSQNPGKMMKDYLGGKRKRYLSAGKYTLLFVVLYTLNISLLENHYGLFETATQMIDSFSVTQVGDTIHLSDEDTQKNLVKKNPEAVVIEDPKVEPQGVINLKEENKVHVKLDLLGQSINKKASKAEFLEFIKVLIPKYHKTLFDTLKFLLALWIPIFAFFSFLLFRKQKMNFAEHLVINSYIYSQLLLITLLLSGVSWFVPNFTGPTFLAIFASTTFYLFFAYLQIFDKASRRLLRATASVMLASFAYGTVLMATVIAIVAIIAIENIDQL